MWASTAPTLEDVFKYGQKKIQLLVKNGDLLQKIKGIINKVFSFHFFSIVRMQKCANRKKNMVWLATQNNMEIWTQCRNLVNGKILANFNLKNMIS